MPGSIKSMPNTSREVPDTVHQAAAEVWAGWRNRLAEVRPATTPKRPNGRGGPALANDQPAEARMIAKIKHRMREFPDWYETDPARVSGLVVRELERIGTVLEHEFPRSDQPVEVWRVPLSVFNWLVDGSEGETFVRGALKAWSSAQCFNAGNGCAVSEEQAARMRAPFLEIAPPLLKAVLEQLLNEDFWVTLHQVYVGADFKYLGLRVQRLD